MTTRDSIQANTVCMVWCIAVVAKEKDIFVVGAITDRARPRLLLFGILVKPCLRIKLGDLLLVLNLVGRDQSTFASRLAWFYKMRINRN